jgi:transposase
MAQEEAYKQEEGWLRCLHGIDTVTATALVAELFRFERFNSPKELMAYLGLTPSEESSGEKIRKGAITKTGNRRIRRLLVEAAWQYRHRPTSGKALKTRREGQPEWVIQTADKARRRLYNRYWRLIRRGKPSGVATTAIARELVGFLWSVMYTKVEVLENAA